MRRYLLEECYELLEAIDGGDPKGTVEELGDVLFHLAFQVRLGIEEGTFTDEQVFRDVIDKLVRRHPHVFGESRVSSARQVESNWHAIKRQEHKDREASVLDGVPKEMPALSYAQAIQERAARAGFDWEDVRGVVKKVREELDELQAARSPAEVEAELGDLLFSLVALGRWLGADAEGAVRGAGVRFRRRFSAVEKLSAERGVSVEGLATADKEELWREAKGLLDEGK
jgi:MazG family protein